MFRFGESYRDFLLILPRPILSLDGMQNVSHLNLPNYFLIIIVLGKG